MKKTGFLVMAAVGTVAIGVNVLYALLVILAESTWGPLAESPTNRFAVVGITGVIYFVFAWFTLSMLKHATKSKHERRRARSTEEAPPYVGLAYIGMGLIVWFGGTYATTIDRTEVYGGIVILLIASMLLSAGAFVLSRTNA